MHDRRVWQFDEFPWQALVAWYLVRPVISIESQNRFLQSKQFSLVCKRHLAYQDTQTLF